MGGGVQGPGNGGVPIDPNLDTGDAAPVGGPDNVGPTSGPDVVVGAGGDAPAGGDPVSPGQPQLPPNGQTLDESMNILMNDPAAQAMLDDPGFISGVTSFVESIGGDENMAAMLLEIMSLLIELGSEQKRGQKTLSFGEALSSFNSKMDAADKMESAAMTRLVTGIASAAITMAGAGIGLRTGAAGGGTQASMQAGQMQSQVVGQLGEVVKHTGDYMATLDDADAKREEAEATMEQYWSDNFKDLSQSTKEMIQAGLSNIRELIQDHKSANSKTAANI